MIEDLRWENLKIGNAQFRKKKDGWHTEAATQRGKDAQSVRSDRMKLT
jgi:hypothetical protein